MQCLLGKWEVLLRNPAAEQVDGRRRRLKILEGFKPMSKQDRIALKIVGVLLLLLASIAVLTFAAPRPTAGFTTTLALCLRIL